MAEKFQAAQPVQHRSTIIGAEQATGLTPTSGTPVAIEEKAGRKIGTLGNAKRQLVFWVSKDKISTFENMRWDTGARFHVHNRHLKEPLTEFLGNDVDTITFSVLFSRYLGVAPFGEIKKLHYAKTKGEILKLTIAKSQIGYYRWVIVNTSTEMQRWHKNGTLMEARISITLKSYAKR